MKKSHLYALRALCAAEALATSVFTQTQKAVKLIPLWLAVWLAVEALNALKSIKKGAEQA